MIKKRKCRMVGAVFIIAMLTLLIIQPAVLADEIVETKVSYYRIPYGTGTDTDGDGIIDNWGETDVEFGTVNMSDLKPLTDGWNNNFQYFGTSIINRNDYGYSVTGYHEELWEIESSSNESVNPTASCYTHDETEIKDVSNVLGVASFYVKLSANDLLSGAQEFWYRSPLCWDDTVFAVKAHESEPVSIPEHYLNIYNEDNELVWASPEPSKFVGSPYPRNESDDSTEGYPYERIYYKISFPFRPNVKYRFEEYVKTIDDNPVNSLKLFMARMQDVGNDGYTTTYIFRGSPYTRLIPEEVSWSMLITMGLGLAGTEKVIFSGSEKPRLDFRNYVFVGTELSGGDEVEGITIIFPLRTTKPLDLKVRATTWAGVSEWQSDWILYEDVVGIAILDMDVTDPNKLIPTRYTFEIIIDNFDEGSGDAMTYTMYPGEPEAFHIVYNNDGIEDNAEICFFSPMIEVKEHIAAPGTGYQGTEDDGNLLGFLGLMGIILIVAGVIALKFLVTVKVGVVAIATGIALISAATVGSWVLTGDPFYWITVGLARIARTVYDGINEITGGLLDVIVKVVETIVHTGELVLRNAGAILAAILDIIYFLTAFIVWWLTAKFLAIMTSIRKGEIDQAGRQIVRVEGALKKRTRQIRRPIKRTRKRVTRMVKR